MLYLVTGNFDNGEEYEDHMEWDDIYGVVDSIELGKEWVLKIKQKFEDSIKHDIENIMKCCPEIEETDYGIYDYQEREDGDGYKIRFFAKQCISQDLDCWFSIDPIEVNKPLLEELNN